MINSQIRQIEMFPAFIADSALFAIKTFFAVPVAIKRNIAQIRSLRNVVSGNNVLQHQGEFLVHPVSDKFGRLWRYVNSNPLPVEMVSCNACSGAAAEWIQKVNAGFKTGASARTARKTMPPSLYPLSFSRRSICQCKAGTMATSGFRDGASNKTNGRRSPGGLPRPAFLQHHVPPGNQAMAHRSYIVFRRCEGVGTCSVPWNDTQSLPQPCRMLNCKDINPVF